MRSPQVKVWLLNILCMHIVLQVKWDYYNFSEIIKWGHLKPSDIIKWGHLKLSEIIKWGHFKLNER